MKKVRSLALLALMAGGLFVGCKDKDCGGGGNSTADPNTNFEYDIEFASKETGAYLFASGSGYSLEEAKICVEPLAKEPVFANLGNIISGSSIKFEKKFFSSFPVSSRKKTVVFKFKNGLETDTMSVIKTQNGTDECGNPLYQYQHYYKGELIHTNSFIQNDVVTIYK